MKNFKTKLLGLALAGLILGACSQTGTYETADLMNEQAVANKAGFTMTPFGTGNENARTYSATDCENFCIDPDAPEYSMQPGTISNNSGPNTRVFNYTVHNTLTGFELAWNYAATNNAGRKLRITVSGAGFAAPQTYTSNQVQTAGNGSNSFTFDASWAACGVVTIVAVMLDGDNNVMVSGPITTTYGLIGACGGCDDEFSAVTTCSEDGSMRTATFTFTAGDDATYKIQGGLTAKSHNVDVNGATVIKVTKNNNNIISWTGALEECDVHTITVSWHSTNSDDEITGDWTVEKDGVKILVIDELGCDDEGEGYAPEVI